MGSVKPFAIAGARAISRDVYIKGLPGFCSEDEFGEVMEQYGEINNLALWKMPNVSNSFMFATVTYRDYDSAFAAIDELDNTLMFGRRVSVEFSRSVVKSASIQKQKDRSAQQKSEKSKNVNAVDAASDEADSDENVEDSGSDSKSLSEKEL